MLTQSLMPVRGLRFSLFVPLVALLGSGQREESAEGQQGCVVWKLEGKGRLLLALGIAGNSRKQLPIGTNQWAAVFLVQLDRGWLSPYRGLRAAT